MRAKIFTDLKLSPLLHPTVEVVLIFGREPVEAVSVPRRR